MTVFATVVEYPLSESDQPIGPIILRGSAGKQRRRRVRGTTEQQALQQISQRSQQWLRWYEGLENAEGISVTGLPDEVQKGLKAVVREIRKLEEVANQG